EDACSTRRAVRCSLIIPPMRQVIAAPWAWSRGRAVGRPSACDGISLSRGDGHVMPGNTQSSGRGTAYFHARPSQPGLAALDEAVLGGGAHGGGARGDIQLAVDPPEMLLDRAPTEEEPPRDLGVGEPLGHQPEHLEFARG